MAGELLDNHGRGDTGWQWPSVHPEGRRFGLTAVGVALVLLVVLGWTWAGWAMMAAAAAIFAFFRDPERVVPRLDRSILSPADGMVSMIARVDPPAELRMDDGSGIAGLSPGPVTRVSIFMSIFDVHINRSPVAGMVRRVVYLPGRLARASDERTSEDQEQQHMLVERADGLKIGFTQVAGRIARRIVPFCKPGDALGAGQRVGLIRFGSRVDIYLPPDTDACVLLGQRVVAGETVLAEIGRRVELEGVVQ